MRKLTFEFVKSRFEDKGYTLLEIEYVNSNTKMRFECPKHIGLTNEIRYNDLRNGVGCRYCGTESCDQKRRTPFTKVKNEFKQRGYILIDSSLKNSNKPLRFICPNHEDKDTRISYQQLRKGVGCAYCAGVGKYRYDEVYDIFKERGYKLLSEEYANSFSKLSYQCETHSDKKLSITLSNFLKGQGCPYCAGSFKYTYEEVKRAFEETGYELLEDKYVGNKVPMKYKCPNHPDKPTYLSIKELKRGTRCRYCYLENSKGINHPGYNPNLTDEEREQKRFYFDYYEWRRKVFERDQYTCVVCGDRSGGNLVAHHKDGYGWCKERRTDETNGVTLCESCHKDFHSIYGYRNNTEGQYLDWIKSKEEAE